MGNFSNKIHPHQEVRRHPDTHFHQEAQGTIQCTAMRHTHSRSFSFQCSETDLIISFSADSQTPGPAQPGRKSYPPPVPSQPPRFSSQGAPQKDRSPAPPGGTLGLLQVGSTHARAHRHAQADLPAAAAPSAGHCLWASQVIPQSPARRKAGESLLCACFLVPASLLLLE